MSDLVEDIEKAFAFAKKTQKPILLQFTAKWCGACKKQERILQKEIIPEYKNKILFSLIDIEAHPDTAERFYIMSIPAMVLCNPDSVEKWRSRGVSSSENISKALDAELSNSIK